MSSYKISKLKKSGLVDLRRKVAGKDFGGALTRFRQGGDMAAETTDLHFLGSRDRLNMPEEGNYPTIDQTN